MDQASLESLLLAYRPDNAVENEFRRQMLVLLESASLSWCRTNFAPGHFTASAYVFDPATDQVAMIYHRNLQRWLQPGGHVEGSDTDAVSSARRELKEETGLDLDGEWQLIDLDIHLIPPRPDQPEHRHFDLRFVHFLDTGKSRPELAPADDASDAMWMPISTLLENEEPGMRRVAGKILEMKNSRLGKTISD